MLSTHTIDPLKTTISLCTQYTVVAATAAVATTVVATAVATTAAVTIFVFLLTSFKYVILIL